MKLRKRIIAISMALLMACGVFTTVAALPQAGVVAQAASDLKITMPNMTLRQGETKTFVVSFSGQGIAAVSGSYQGNRGLTVKFGKITWRAYPNTCTAELKVTASNNAQTGWTTFNLLDDDRKVILSKTANINVTEAATTSDLKLSVPGSIKIKPGETKSYTVTFSGQGIGAVNCGGSSGITAKISKTEWKAYPNTCKSVVKVTASKKAKSGSVTFYLLDGNKKSALSKKTKISVVTYDADAIIESAEKKLKKTKKQLGYTTDWCAYFVCDILKENGVDIGRQGGPRSLTISALNKGKAVKYYSFREKNTKDLYNKGLDKDKRSLVEETSRSKVTPKKGDVIIFRWTSESAQYQWSHVGFVKDFDEKNNKVITIEGNTNGGIVDERPRAYDKTVVGILRFE